jgi:hypothetical protein
MTGIPLRCKYCGRPIIGPAVYGNVADPYHPECTRPPMTPDAAMFQRMHATLESIEGLLIRIAQKST